MEGYFGALRHVNDHAHTILDTKDLFDSNRATPATIRYWADRGFNFPPRFSKEILRFAVREVASTRWKLRGRFCRAWIECRSEKEG